MYIDNKGKRLDNSEAFEIKKFVQNNEHTCNNHKKISYSPMLNTY